MSLYPQLQKPTFQSRLKQEPLISILSGLLIISLVANIVLIIIALGVFKPVNTVTPSYTAYSDSVELDNKSYIGELVQFRASSFDLVPGKTKNEYIWKFSGRNYGVVLRFPVDKPNIKPILNSTGLYSGKFIARETSIPIVQVEDVKG
jgi:hypothetical protein